MRSSCIQLTAHIADRYRSAVEIGFGGVIDVVRALKERGLRVAASDIRRYSFQGLRTFVDDITVPKISLYRGAQVLYAIRPPVELVPYMWCVAEAVFARAIIIKPLSGEYPGGRIEGKGNGVFFVQDVNLKRGDICVQKSKAL